MNSCKNEEIAWIQDEQLSSVMHKEYRGKTKLFFLSPLSCRYSSNGLLSMLDRNRKIKHSPEKWQESTQEFDVIITCEERCFDAVCEGKEIGPPHLKLLRLIQDVQTQCVLIILYWICGTNYIPDLITRGESHNNPVHVINVDIKDNYEEAMVGGRMILNLAQSIDGAKDLDQEIQPILDKFQQRYPSAPVLHSVSFF